MKVMTSLLVAALSVPVSAGVIRHDTPDSWYTSYATDPTFKGVGLIFGDTADTPYSCSGTVIHKNWVLTAGHCVDQAKAMTFHLPSETGWRFYESKSWIAHENFVRSGLVAGWDIGLMYFDTDFDVAPAQLYSGDAERLASSVSVGYGYTGNGETGMTHVDYQPRAGTNIIDDLWSQEGNGRQIMWSDFDHPVDPTFNLFDFPFADFDNLATALEILVVPGDSGGGVFVEESGQIYLAGVHSFVADARSDGILGYGDAYGSTRVSSFSDWISSKLRTHEVPESSGVLLLLLGGLGLLMRCCRSY